MPTQEIMLGKNKKSIFKDHVMSILPDGGNLNLCLTCGACASGCPAAGIGDMDPRRFLRLAAMGADDEILSDEWAWYCTMCQRCIYACPMKIDIPQLIFNVRASWPRESRPKGIVASCDAAFKHDTCSAMGVSEEDWHFVVEDVVDEVRANQKGFEELRAPMDKAGAELFVNQNSREPVTEPEEMVPLWKILDIVGADWTYGSKGWGAENYCMFMADDASWKKLLHTKVKAVEDLGCKVWLNTE